jgi:hypothetical protein
MFEAHRSDPGFYRLTCRGNAAAKVDRPAFARRRGSLVASQVELADGPLVRAGLALNVVGDRTIASTLPC